MDYILSDHRRHRSANDSRQVERHNFRNFTTLFRHHLPRRLSFSRRLLLAAVLHVDQELEDAAAYAPGRR